MGRLYSAAPLFPSTWPRRWWVGTTKICIENLVAPQVCIVFPLRRIAYGLIIILQNPPDCGDDGGICYPWAAFSKVFRKRSHRDLPCNGLLTSGTLPPFQRARSAVESDQSLLMDEANLKCFGKGVPTAKPLEKLKDLTLQPCVYFSYESQAQLHRNSHPHGNQTGTSLAPRQPSRGQGLSCFKTHARRRGEFFGTATPHRCPFALLAIPAYGGMLETKVTRSL